MKKRILAMLMCLMLIFSSSNVAFATENLGNIVAETQNQAVETVTDTKAAEEVKQATVKIHFRNEGFKENDEERPWRNINAWIWQVDGEDEVSVEGYEDYHDTWPGASVGQNQAHPRWFTIEVVVKDLDKDLNIIFNGDRPNEDKKETSTVTISKEDFADGEDEVWVYPKPKGEPFYLTRVINDDTWTNTYDSIVIGEQVVGGNKVTFKYKNDSLDTLYIRGNMNGWWQNIQMTNGNNGEFTYTFPALTAGVYEYRLKVNDDWWLTDPENGMYRGDNQIAIIPGVTLPKGVEAARGKTTKLPSRMQRVLENGEVESVGVTYELSSAVNGASLNGIDLTVDAGFAGDSIQLNVLNEAGETAILEVAVIDGNVVVSPVTNENAITFSYRNANATSVYLAGDMTNWGDNKVAMTKDQNTNIWSVTVNKDYQGNTMYAGAYQYKFVVYEDDEERWIIDPRNDNFFIDENNNVNSLVIVKGSAPDTDKITVKIHYSGRDNFTNWNIWAWNDEMADQIKLEAGDNSSERIATIKLDSARANQYLKFIPREGEWDSQDGGERYVDLSDMLAGTAHVYLKAGENKLTRRLDSDALLGVKVKRADYDRKKNQVIVQTSLPIEGDMKNAFKFDCVTDDRTFTISNVSHKFESGVNKYTLTLAENITTLDNVIKYYTVEFGGYKYKVFMPNVYADAEFEETYTYTGKDLGATWSETSTTFKLWAPTADDVKLNLYATGSAPLDESEIGNKVVPENITETPFRVVQMVKGEKGVWSVIVDGNLHGTYYTYSVSIGGETNEASDPYARTTGVNGKRAMVINLDSTDPEGWAGDKSPNQGMNQTDAIIYELHVRDLSIDESSGVSDANKGKFLGVTERGTTNATGQPTGLDHIIDLGVTHIHFLPIYDYGSVDEADSSPQFNWGYDPANYNVPEGSYSTDPYNGAVRVAELKEMVQTLHENNINVIMDVVYNHVYDAGKFAFNQIVPDYFSRTTEDGNYSSRSGCGNDTASERDMVRKYIVESVLYWAEEYHLDGFRFDLVGLVDVNTINQIVTEVHKINPSIVFYGEGWDMDGTVMNPREPLAKQGNAYLTPGFAYFSDTIRDLLRGNNDNVTNLGYVSGLTGKEEAVRDAFMARTWWTSNPTQIINYASCHDNYTVMDKINEGRKDASFADRVKMNNLSAAIYMLAEGVPLIHAGEEMLRTKVDEKGHIIHNSYKSSDYVNSIKWSNLSNADYQNSDEYYEGLVEFRKNHEALRLTTAEQITNNVSYHWVDYNVVLFKINGKASVPGEVSDSIIVIFNPTNQAKDVNLSTYGTGEWKVCIDDKNAGAEVLRTVSGTVTVAPISALVLVQGETVDTESVYLNNIFVPVESVTLDNTAVQLKPGETVKLAATVNPSSATNKTITWSTSNAAVATVNNGVVTAVADGTAAITVKAGTKTETCTITVKSPAIEVSSVSLDKTTAELKVGETLTLNATVNPENATDKTVTWSTSDANVVTVNNGVVTAVAAGGATITATAGAKVAVCTITVKSATTEPETPSVVEVSSVTLNKTVAELKAGEKLTLTATVNPENATDKTVKWSTSDAKVATVNNGVVTAVADGAAVITATAGAKTATCTITVKTPAVEPEKPANVAVKQVKLNKSSANIGVGKTLTLKATVTPSNATNKKVTWVSSNKKVATVDKNGKVKGVKAGTATITVKTANGKKATCKVTVVKATLNASSVPLQVKKTVTLKATSTLKSDKVKSWKSSNKKIATVTSKGVVKGVKAGKATITVTMKSGATATCKVTVQKAKVTTKKLTFEQKKVTLQKGKTVTLTVTRNPISATEKITWKTSNKKVATVDKNGKVKGIKAGTATITATTSNGKKATCKVTVKNPTVKLDKTSATVKVGKTTTIKIKSKFPENDTVKSYTSSNKKIATVDKNGKVKGIKAGKATITVKMKSGATAKFTVTVKK